MDNTKIIYNKLPLKDEALIEEYLKAINSTLPNSTTAIANIRKINGLDYWVIDNKAVIKNGDTKEEYISLDDLDITALIIFGITSLLGKSEEDMIIESDIDSLEFINKYLVDYCKTGYKLVKIEE